MGSDPAAEAQRARLIRTLEGPIDAASIGPALAAEVLLHVPAPRHGNTGTPASDAAFDRAPVTMHRLGALQLGAMNRDDETLGEAEAGEALRRWVRALADPNGAVIPGTPLVVALAPEVGREARVPGALGRLGGESGVAIVRGASPTDPDLSDAGLVGAVSAESPALLEQAAARAAAADLPLALAPVGGLPELRRVLARVAGAGLFGSRVLITGVAGLIAAVHAPGVPGVGADPDLLDQLIELLGEHGAGAVFDDLGRVPSVATVVSDHDVACAILRAAEQGVGHLLMVSAGVRAKHRLSQFGGGGLEFVHTQFLPYLGVLGASPELLHGVGGAHLARFLRVDREDH
ncbi:hypothetical protein [Leucobacter chromiireducens]|uniref:Uncharacterized protein n=1 Tax=Leucobacter chromiireducens subsp. chromiireducens TaxID=660067 RepID=A0ABS1SP71_9MICO|nr:hypothetical protein [Leucobacter chromiireducens]MBL3689954.1 hypothetical protein [Leucobacter chromiireducens subsp. chromiireducens]